MLSVSMCVWSACISSLRAPSPCTECLFPDHQCCIWQTALLSCLQELSQDSRCPLPSAFSASLPAYFLFMGGCVLSHQDNRSVFISYFPSETLHCRRAAFCSFSFTHTQAIPPLLRGCLSWLHFSVSCSSCGLLLLTTCRMLPGVPRSTRCCGSDRHAPRPGAHEQHADRKHSSLLGQKAEQKREQVASSSQTTPKHPIGGRAAGTALLGTPMQAVAEGLHAPSHCPSPLLLVCFSSLWNITSSFSINNI